MGFLELDGVQKSFGAHDRRSSTSTSTSSAASSSRSSGPSRLRQDDDAADDRRLRDADRRARSGSTARTSPDRPPNRRNVGMVFQSYALFPNMTVADNIGFGLKVREAAERRDRGRGSRRCSS